MSKNRHTLKCTVWFYSLSFSYSLPKEVCSVLLDSECLRPIHSVCNMVEPSEECQLVLHHFFNDSGVYCINVSLTNDVSLAVTSAKVHVDLGMQHNPPYISNMSWFGLTAFDVSASTWQCDPCFRFWFVLVWNYRHAAGCPSICSGSRNSGIFLQVRTSTYF